MGVTTGENRVFTTAEGRVLRFRFFRTCGKCRAEGPLKWTRRSSGSNKSFHLVTQNCTTGHGERCHIKKRVYTTGTSGVGQTGFEMQTEDGGWQAIGDRTALEELFPRPSM